MLVAGPTSFLRRSSHLLRPCRFHTGRVASCSCREACVYLPLRRHCAEVTYFNDEPRTRFSKSDTSVATEFEHVYDDTTMHLPRPGPGGFARGSFIGWRRHERVRDGTSGASTEPELPRVDNLYEVMDTIGEGGFGVVRRALHRRTGEAVAIKAICSAKVKEPEDLRREVEFLRVADHPNVIRYYETLQDDQHHYLVMELCTGGSLSQHIQNWHENGGVGLSELDLARVVVQMLRGVAYCHQHGIVHRDVKPQNFLFGCRSLNQRSAVPIACSGNSDAPLKLVDFGISGVVRCDRPSKRLLTRRAGTEGYMAPEVFLGLPYGSAADMFSCGAVMHKILTGKAPLWEADKGAYKFPGKVRWNSLSSEGQDLLRCLLHVDSTDRPTACEAVGHPWFEAIGVTDPGAACHDLAGCIHNISLFARRSKLQRSIMYSTVAFATQHSHEMERLRIAFLAADISHTGGIPRDKFQELFRRYGNGDEDADPVFAALDNSKSGEISYSEWLTATAPIEWFREPRHAQRAFETLDVDRNGWICAADICHLFPDVFDHEQIVAELKGLFPFGDGHINFQDFCALSCH